MMNLIKDHQFSGRKVVARFDFNVPIKEGKILDTTRIDLSLETIKFLLNEGASKIVMISHLGSPKGQFKKELSLEPIGKYIAEKLNEEVTLTQSAKDRGIKTMLSLPNSRLILLENIRFPKNFLLL